MEFWRRALDYVPRDGELDERADDSIILVPSSGSGAALALDTSVTPVQALPRVHLDLYVDSTTEFDAETARLVELGAQRVEWEHYPPDAAFVVLADTEGNRFCIVDKSRDH
jgi:hypothetical protein